MIPPAIPVPGYGTRSLGEVLPSIFGALGVPGFSDLLALGPARGACLFLIDGLGWEGLKANADAAPYLNSIAREPLTTGFPATTVASNSLLATGLAPGITGLVGYTMALPGFDRALNGLTWSSYGLGLRVDLREEVVPEVFQSEPTLAERAATAGLRLEYAGPPVHDGSGLTRAVWRGSRFHPAEGLETVVQTALTLLGASRLVLGYHPRLDTAGHIHGVRSQTWRDELIAIDRAIREIAERLPADTVLVVTGDHGMVDLRPEQRLDLADHPDLAAGVALLAGEARARYVRAVPGATPDVLGAWRSVLGDRMWIWTRDEAIATGIFGPRVTDRTRERLGDIVAAAFDAVGIVQRDVDPAQARLNGHHGSLTDAERLVPLLVYRP